MGVRVVVAGIVGGLLMFFCGFVEHMVLGWSGRQYLEVQNEKEITDFIGKNFTKPGLYGVPQMPKNPPADQFDKIYNEVNERYKTGRNAMIFVGPAGEDMMGPKQLGGEAVTNILAALFTAFILSHVRPDVGFARRWFLAFLIGPLTWVSVDASYHLWYRFPQGFILDQLYCALVEWAVAAIAIAAIVKVKTPTA